MLQLYKLRALNECIHVGYLFLFICGVVYINSKECHNECYFFMSLVICEITINKLLTELKEQVSLSFNMLNTPFHVGFFQKKILILTGHDENASNECCGC